MKGRYTKRGYKKQQSVGHIGDVVSDALHDIPGRKKGAEMEIFYQWHHIAQALHAENIRPIKIISHGAQRVLRCSVRGGDALLWEYRKMELLEVIHRFVGANVVDAIQFTQQLD